MTLLPPIAFNAREASEHFVSLDLKKGSNNSQSAFS
jgi:hypothetical protein